MITVLNLKKLNILFNVYDHRPLIFLNTFFTLGKLKQDIKLACYSLRPFQLFSNRLWWLCKVNLLFYYTSACWAGLITCWFESETKRTICPGSSNPFFIVTSWTHSILRPDPRLETWKKCGHWQAWIQGKFRAFTILSLGESKKEI